MGADIYQVDTKDGWSPLHYAVQNGNIDMIKFLLQNGANIYRRTYTKKTTLQIAEENHRPEIIEILLEFLKEQPSHKILEKETDPWLGNGDCEVWVGDRNSCNEERTKACDINCVISLLSTRSMTKAPAQWLKYEYDIEHYHFECNDAIGSKSWKELLRILPEFGNLLSKKLYEGKKVLIHCRKGTTVSPSALLSMLIIKRGITNDPTRNGSPYMRIEEMFELYNNRHPVPNISKDFIYGLEHFQKRIDKKRIDETYEKIDNLLRVI